MISSSLRDVRLGYTQTGGEARLRVEELQGRLLIGGSRAGEMAALLAYASREAGLRPLILDLDGRLCSSVSGYFSTSRLAHILYDLYRMDEAAPRRHGELVASAYAAGLDLTFEEEAIMDAAMQQLASQDNMASPPAVCDALSGVEGFRGFYVDKLKGRIGALKSLDAADSIRLSELLARPEGAVLDLSGPEMPRAAELGAALLVAKLLATVDRVPGQDLPSFVLLGSAHRLFRALPKTLHGNRLFTAMLASPLTWVFASDQLQAMSPPILQACPVRMLSADAWDSLEGERRRWRAQNRPSPVRGDRPLPPPPLVVLPNSFVLEDGFYGVARPFVMRPFEAKAATTPEKDTGSPGTAEAGPPPPGQELTRRILQEIKAYGSPTIPSLASYLAGEFPKDEVETAIDALEREGCVKLLPKEHRSGRTMLVLQLTPKGEELSRRLV